MPRTSPAHGHHQRGATGTARCPLPDDNLRPQIFWAAYALTRPLGANAGNTLSKARDPGGLGIGTYGASAVPLGLLVICLCYQIFARRRQTRVLADAGGCVTAVGGAVDRVALLRTACAAHARPEMLRPLERLPEFEVTELDQLWTVFDVPEDLSVIDET